MSEDRGSAADQVKALVEAAERIRADAEREAGEARAGVERVAQRADELRARLDELAGAVEAAVTALKGEIDALREPSEAPRDELIAEAEAASAREPEVEPEPVERPVDTARQAISQGRPARDESEPGDATGGARPDDDDVESSGLAGAQLLQEALGAEVIEEIPHA